MRLLAFASRQIGHAATLAVLALFAPASAAAQTVSLDDGSFRILIDGREVGTESFSIRQNGSGSNAVIIARGTATVDTSGAPVELTSTLQVTGTELRPAAYNVVVRGGESERIAGRMIDGRFSAQIVSPAGEQMREYLASEGGVLVDEGIVHQHYFLARRVDGTSRRVPMIIPRLNRQVSAEVNVAGRESIAVAGRQIEALRLVVTPTGAPERHLWVDAEGRVLQLEIPGQRLLARRAVPPR